MTKRSDPLIRSKSRVRDLGEVFTPDFLVTRMLDSFPASAWEPGQTWLEPTCGNGQFVIAIMHRRLALGQDIFQVLNTVFGADIMADNVSECHRRIYREVVLPWAADEGLPHMPEWASFRRAVACIVEHNIRHTRDSLREDFASWTTFRNASFDYQGRVATELARVICAIDSGLELTENLRDRRIYNRLYAELSVFGGTQ